MNTRSAPGFADPREGASPPHCLEDPSGSATPAPAEGRQGFIGSTECLGTRAADAPPLADPDRRFPWSGSFAVSRPGYDYACAVARYLETLQPGNVGRLLGAFSAKKTRTWRSRMLS